MTIRTSEVLSSGEGIRFAKAHLMSALHRGLGIPVGFCCQRVMRRGTPESGDALPGLNAAFFPSAGWVRLDPHGDKPGVQSDFSLSAERLAHTLDAGLGEIDDPDVFVRPLESVVESMHASGGSRKPCSWSGTYRWSRQSRCA